MIVKSWKQKASANAQLSISGYIEDNPLKKGFSREAGQAKL